MIRVETQSRSGLIETWKEILSFLHADAQLAFSSGKYPPAKPGAL